MTIDRTTLKELADAERAEIEDRLARADGFVSDEGDTMAWHLLAFVAALLGVIAVIVERATAYTPLSLPTSLPGLTNNPTLPGLAVAVPVIVFTVVTFLRVHKRHGWLATSFGVVRLRGQNVRLLRYPDIARAARRRVQSGRSFSVLELTAKDGKTMTTYATPLMDTILARVPPAAIAPSSVSARAGR